MERYLIIYDGECGICDRARLWTSARIKSGEFVFIPYQDFEQLDSELPFGKDKASKAVVMVDRVRMKHYFGARAAFEIMKLLPGIYGFIGSLLSNSFVAALAAPFYRLIAANRRKISIWMGLKACALRPKDHLPSNISDSA